MDHLFCAVALPMWRMWSPASVQNDHTAAPVKVAAPELLEPSEPSEPPEPTPARAGTLGNLPPEPTPARAGTCRNPPEPASGTCFETYTSTPARAGTFRNLPPEPAPATRAGTHRSLSGLKTPLAYAVGQKIRADIPPWSWRSTVNSINWLSNFNARMARWQHLRLNSALPPLAYRHQHQAKHPDSSVLVVCLQTLWALFCRHEFSAKIEVRHSTTQHLTALDPFQVGRLHCNFPWRLPWPSLGFQMTKAAFGSMSGPMVYELEGEQLKKCRERFLLFVNEHLTTCYIMLSL